MPYKYSASRDARKDVGGSRTPFTFRGKIEHETDKAYQVRPLDYVLVGRSACIWLPKSQTKIIEFGYGVETFAIPFWLANERGFVQASYRPVP
jgi:hypothetical protein